MAARLILAHGYRDYVQPGQRKNRCPLSQPGRRLPALPSIRDKLKNNLLILTAWVI